MMKSYAEIIRLQIVINGRHVQEYRGSGGATFIEGKPNVPFEISVQNLTPRRILVYPTVDGLSVMNGKPAALEDNTNGYVLYAYQCTRIPGWRLDNKEIAQFYFTSNSASYAEKTGFGENKGVIACAVFDESVQPDYPTNPCYFNTDFRITHSVNTTHEVTGCTFSKQAPSVRRCCEPVQNLGTGFGVKASHVVGNVQFDALPNPTCVAIIYYDDREGLKAKGINIAPQPVNRPNPFPKSSGCTPPDGWTGQ